MRAIGALVKYRFLLWQLVKRDYKIRYKRSVLGVAWSMLNPLLTMLVLSVVFSHFFRFEIENYPVYLISGQVVFSFFCESTNLAMTSITASGALLHKVYIPKFIFPLSKVLTSTINLAFSLLAMLAVMAFTGSKFHATLLLLPLPLLFILLFSLGLGMGLCAACVFFRDLTHIYSLFLSVVVYATPIFYPAGILPQRALIILRLNPLYYFVEYFRTIAVYGVAPPPLSTALCALLSLTALALGGMYFSREQQKFLMYV